MTWYEEINDTDDLNHIPESIASLSIAPDNYLHHVTTTSAIFALSDKTIIILITGMINIYILSSFILYFPIFFSMSRINTKRRGD